MAATTKKRVTTKKTPTLVHECLHEDKFSELDKRTKETHAIITGNGTPENGLVVQMVKVNLTQTEILKTLGKLDSTIEGLTKKYEESISTANLAKHAVEAYKKEMRAFDEGKESEQAYFKAKNERIKMINDLQHSKYTRWITTISVVIAALALIYSVFFKDNTSGTPVAVTRSGRLYPLPDSVQVGIFDVDHNISEDTINDSIY